MAAVKRHWKSATLLVLILCLLVLSGLASSLFGPRADVRSAFAEGEAGVDEVTLSRVAVLRERLCLTNQDLSAMGLERQKAEEVLTALLEWTQANAEAIQQKDQSIRAAKRSVRDAFERINVGPRNEGVIAGLPNLQAGQARAEADLTTLYAQAEAEVEELISAEQEQIWATAKANRGAPSELRFAPGLSEQQIQAYRLKLRRREASPADAAAAVLQGGQLAAVNQARANQKTFAGDAEMADVTVLPRPISDLQTPQE